MGGNLMWAVLVALLLCGSPLPTTTANTQGLSTPCNADLESGVCDAGTASSGLQDEQSLLQVHHVERRDRAEHFQVPQCEFKVGAIVALISGQSGKFCRDNGARIVCDASSLDANGRFEVLDAGGGGVAFRGGRQGRLCSDEEGAIVCNRERIRKWELFNAVSFRGAVALQGSRSGRYASDTSTGVRCNAGSIGEAEKFRVQCLGSIPDSRFPLLYNLAENDTVVVEGSGRVDSPFEVSLCLDPACKRTALSLSFDFANLAASQTWGPEAQGSAPTRRTWPALLAPAKRFVLTLAWTAARWEVSVDGVRQPALDAPHRTPAAVAEVAVSGQAGAVRIQLHKYDPATEETAPIVRAAVAAEAQREARTADRSLAR